MWMRLSAAPGDLQISLVTSSRVELGWKDNTKGAVAYIVQRCTRSDCADFMNAIGQAGANITTAIDPNVRPGEAYRYRVYAVLPTAQGSRGNGVSNVVTIRLPCSMAAAVAPRVWTTDSMRRCSASMICVGVISVPWSAQCLC